MTDDDERDTPGDLSAALLNPLPWSVWVILLPIAGVEAVLQLAHFGILGGEDGLGWRIAAIQRYAYSSALQDWMLQTWQFPAMHLLRYLSYGILHTGAMHALFGLVLVAALGKLLGERFGALRFLVLALAVPMVSASLFGAMLGGDQSGWLIGAMPLAFGLVGAFTWLQWVEAGNDAARRRRAFGLIGMLLAARLGFGLFAETGPAWIAELIAFALGFALSALLLGPGSWQRTRARLRGGP